MRSPACSRASSPTWSAATARPTATGSARNSSTIRTTAPAAPATAIVCGPRRWRSKIGGPARRAGRADVDPRCTTTGASRCPTSSSKQKNEIARAILKEIRERLGFLNNVGLEYLTLSRNSGTLSGGESQRIRLASQIGSGLTGVLYVLDEPSIGLHQRDNDRLLTTLKNLRDQGNTVIVVEHDEEAIREADYVFDIGPGAGVHGGQIVAQGHARRNHGRPRIAITGQYLTGSARNRRSRPSGARGTARRSRWSRRPATTCKT